MKLFYLGLIALIAFASCATPAPADKAEAASLEAISVNEAIVQAAGNENGGIRRIQQEGAYRRIVRQ